ncbi:MAG: SDR family oxidoreductase [Myxococcales bacterium]|nr:SDR family oxidoreductase [Myxococcales bacterium]
MKLDLHDHVILVTGASGGIGGAIARTLAGAGATVVAHGHRGFDGLKPWCEPLGIHTERGDLSDPQAVDALFERLVATHGRVDGVACNAGRWPVPDLHLHDTSVASLRETIEDCLWTAMWTARSWMASLANTGPRADGIGGSLVFTGSTAGRFGEPGHAAYATAKAALHGLMCSLKNEVVHHDPWARVNLVQPGWTATDAVRDALKPDVVDGVTKTMALRRVASAQDIADSVCFLLSPAARHITSETLTVAGGMEGRLLWP